MSDAKRWVMEGQLTANGVTRDVCYEYVLASDYDALRAELADLQARFDQAIINSGHYQTERNVARAEVERLRRDVDTLKRERVTLEAWVQDHHEIEGNLHAALTDLEMAVSDLMREEDFEVSETLSTALDIARAALAADVDDCPHGPGCGESHKKYRSHRRSYLPHI